MATFDVVILGAGGAGMMCALHAARRGRSVAVIDHAKKPGGKIIISGGGRCNFTNLRASSKNYYSQNEHFCKSAMSRYLPEHFIEMVKSHGIAFHERKHGQLFCDSSAQQLIDMFVKDCTEAGVGFFMEHEIHSVRKDGALYTTKTSLGDFESESVVVALGGLSIPKMGATSLGYDIAKHFGLKVTPLAPALDGFVLGDELLTKEGFSGIALDVEMTCNGVTFRENLLFTHVGLSGPVSLQASLHWNPGDPVTVNFLPAFSREELMKWFFDRRTSKAEFKNTLSELLPKRMAERFCDLYFPKGVGLANLPKKDLEAFCEQIQAWTFVPKSTVGYGKAEVTRGGVDTDELSSKTLESKKVPGLFFIGEVVDVTGWLGGFNYQWAWASAWAAAQVV